MKRQKRKRSRVTAGPTDATSTDAELTSGYAPRSAAAVATPRTLGDPMPHLLDL